MKEELPCSVFKSTTVLSMMQLVINITSVKSQQFMLNIVHVCTFITLSRDGHVTKNL